MTHAARARDHQSAGRAGQSTAATPRRAGHPLMGAHDALGNRGMQRLGAMRTPTPPAVTASVTPGTLQRTSAGNVAEPSGSDAPPASPRVQLSAGDAGAPPSRSAAATALSGQRLGRPLDEASRAFMEPRFGRDLGAVRIHTAAAAARSARLLNAHAFTVGDDIHFAGGRYDSATLPDARCWRMN